jgi:hypothetical protein
LTQSRGGEPLGTLALSAHFTECYLARRGVRDLMSLVVSLVAGYAIWRTAQFRMTHAATEAHMRKRRTSNKATISELRTTAGTGLHHPSASALQVLVLQVLALQDPALDARAALRHSVGTPIPSSHITRSLIRKHRLHAQRKKDGRLRRSRNTPFLLRNNRIQSGSILNQSCARDSPLESISLACPRGGPFSAPMERSHPPIPSRRIEARTAIGDAGDGWQCTLVNQYAA